MPTTIQNVRRSQTPPQNAFTWEIELLGNTVSGRFPLLAAQATTIEIPEKSTETITRAYKSRNARFSGRDSSPGTFQVSFWDNENGDVYSYFNDWIENGISNSVTGGGLSRDLYSVELIARLQKTDEVTTSLQHRFLFVWPSTLGAVSLDYDASEHVIIPITFTYDEHLSS